MWRGLSLGGLLAAAVAGIAFANGAFAATIDKFSPQGEVRAVRQVAVRFSEDIVKFGDPGLKNSAATPFAIECSEPGQGRWLDSRAWVFDFTRDLPPGIKCNFKLKPELKALAGGAFTGATQYAFSTGGPAVLQSQPYQGASNIDEEQTFILRLNGAANEASVLEKAWCVAEGIGESFSTPSSCFSTGCRTRDSMSRSFSPASFWRASCASSSSTNR